MAEWHEIQKDFSGGEVGPRVNMRNDAQFHAKSLRRMVNFMPTLQGTARRTPGPRFVYDVGSLNARIFPYLAPDNSRAIVQLLPQVGGTPGTASIVANATEVLETGALPTAPEGVKEIVNNPAFNLGLTGWDSNPIEFTGANGDTLGVFISGEHSIGMQARKWKSADTPANVVTVTNEAIVREASDRIYVRISARYTANFSSPDAEYTMFFKIGTTPGANDIYQREFNHEVGFWDQEAPVLVSGLTLVQDDILYMTVELTAISADTSTDPSAPYFNIFWFGIKSVTTFDIGIGTITGDVPYTAEELKAVQYVQSPYTNSSGAVGKELVFTHPNHTPQEIIWNGSAYVFQPKPFVNFPTTLWNTDTGWPSCCASFNGRLILAGGKEDLILLGTGTGTASETVVGTHVGTWNNFDLETEVDPDDSIEFSTIYRSPIQWVFGQADLLIGALEMEYTASADGVFQPADLGVLMQSTNGSSNVQPVGMGNTVVFPAEGGTKVRSMKRVGYASDNEGWVSPDLTLLHPELCKPGIKRMVRMRNPHQMVVVLLKSGTIVILHQDTSAGIQGWSRLNLNASIKDICVISDDEGQDILFATIVRFINGVKVMYLEAFSGWSEDNDWAYLQSNVSFNLPAPSGTVTDLEHLEGATVEVVGDGNYLGQYTVTGGEILLVDQLGEPIVVTSAIVGLSMSANMITMPLITDDPGSKKRYSDVTVRLNISARPIINGVRPKDRTPINPMGTSEPLDGQRDHTIQNQAWSQNAYIKIEENLPLKVEVIGIFGKFIGQSV